ncbi:DNA-directed RNA polymerase sigma-70 factor [Paenibacillus baekrokdamisoli]|uniref:DNA-directed RNA polymerase sigma-70 factor n=1 Tax=Paenibacillus baekrokdamisoli TaxID=1712516 RepID=A0A3G9JCM9_9BACL|nr:sigma-70 family RNA polymerase sigma factor [Paenibacillus baekrokdamisoli]MBB3068884.1 RNA polymerase sigma-70 factor (ECF subfamily) [Paenibacillus baekrokdamisoli]BBH23711.1 DNA-directed RNA polymerase sigma-70 factor [Paenibacillus baekrokdamisoli]
MQNLSDHELMLLVKGKRHTALSILYDRYAPLIYSFAWKALRDESAARDIVQAVFLRLWTTESDFNPDKGRFTSWLLTITRHITTDSLRKKRRDNAGIMPYFPEELERIPDARTPSPEDRAERQSFKEQIRNAYCHLSKQQILLLEHFYWQGYSLSELAAKYNQPLGTVKNRLHQTLKILRRHLLVEEEGI